MHPASINHLGEMPRLRYKETLADPQVRRVTANWARKNTCFTRHPISLSHVKKGCRHSNEELCRDKKARYADLCQEDNSRKTTRLVTQ
ncbi:hypothetical protein E2C01_000258 [Portunus trituberculatus]|uniref:Uncharacterized protein n=1 Tax=Portunus trituberculatus TaxID=210409 RepID=A0A5B7CJ59_PORTR|nr:hypothetical protein [Portunus trituberculatus]